METVGRIHSLWRYPVKSMRGESLTEAFAGYSGIYGDRLYAFHDAAAMAAFPYLTAREQEKMLLYQPVFRDGEAMRRPPNLDDTETLGPGVTPLLPEPHASAVDVHLPDGSTFAIDDPALIQKLTDGLGARHQLRLLRSDRAHTDCRPVSLFNTATAVQIGNEIGARVDLRCFRANVYIDLDSGLPFAENELVGCRLKIGAKAVVAVLERDPRCKMITLDPDTAEQNPAIMRTVARNHEGCAGLYAAVLVEGAIKVGDPITVVK